MKIPTCYRFCAKTLSAVGYLMKRTFFANSAIHSITITFTPSNECEVLFFSTLSLKKLRKMMEKLWDRRMLHTLNYAEKFTRTEYYFPYGQEQEKQYEAQL
jgi:hypothetical protein